MAAGQTQQQQVFNVATGLYALAQQLKTVRDAYLSFLDTYTTEGIAAVMSNIQTSPRNSDGTISSTPDGTPNPANPMTGAGLNFSRNSVTDLKVALDQFINLYNDAAVTTTPAGQYICDILAGK